MNQKCKHLAKRGLLSAVMLLCTLFSYSQTRTISGRITDLADNAPVVGATVAVKGSNVATQTDASGNFTIEVPSSARVLTVSSVGFAQQDISIGTNSTVNVTMVPSSSSLEDVVVVGYGTQRRREVTSAVATVKEEDFNQGGVRSPVDLIQGKVAGLSVTRTQGNNPNSGAAIQLRGITTLSTQGGATSPLIVVDGIPGGNLDLLQQDDIASFDVLKDGSAAAIYGTRGSNGVILITTKKGKAGEPRFVYSTYAQREVVDKKPSFLSAAEYRALIAEGRIAPANDQGASTDIYDALINRQNISQYHNFSASGGTTKTNYRASVYYNQANGIAIQNGREQYGGRININQRGMQDRLNLQVNLATNWNSANLLGGNGGDFEQAIQRNPTAPIQNEDGTYVQTTAFNNYNPVARLNQELNRRSQQTTSADLKLSLELLRGLTISAFGALVRDNWNDRQYRSMLSFAQRPATQWRGTGYAFRNSNLNHSETFESTVDYQTKIGENHSISAMAGYSYQYFMSEGFSMNNSGFTTDAFLDNNFGAGTAISNTQLPRPGLGSNKTDNTLIAFFGRINYAFANKYFAQAILRREGSSRFGTNYKWGMFPAASVGWAISEEDFMQNLSFINTLKLRVGYGVTGNQNIPNYQSMVTLGTGGVYPQQGVFYQTYGPSRNPNPNLRWETKREWNFGLDFSILNNRLGGALDVYNRRTVDLLYNYTAQLPPFVQSSLYTNVGTISNSGVELLLNAVIVRNKDFSWNMDFTANSQFNKLESLSNDVYKASWLEFGGLPSPGNLGNAIRVEEGGVIGNFYGKRFAGFDHEGRWLFFKADGTTGLASAMTDADRTVIGNGVPKYMASWTNTFRYKQVDLTLFFRGKFAYDILNTQEMYFGNTRWLPNNLLRSAFERHSQLNDNPQYSDYYLEDGSFVKLDNVTVGYNLKPGNSRYFKNIRFYATGRNLATFTGYTGLDPELEDTGFTTGIDGRGFYPRTRSYTLGLIADF